MDVPNEHAENDSSAKGSKGLLVGGKDQNREMALRRSANKRFYQEDFSGLDLSNADFRNATFHECNFRGANLSYANFTSANCWGSDFEDAICYRANFTDAVLANTNFLPREAFGITLTLNCDSFDGMKVSNKLFQYWLYIASLMEPPDKSLSDKLIAGLGAENYVKLAKIFREKEF